MNFQKSFTVFDNALSAHQHTALAQWLENERWEFVQAQRWRKEFPLRDGNPLWGTTYLSHPVDETCPAYPLGSPLDALMEAVLEKAPICELFLGKHPQDWAYFLARPHMYPAGTSLSWHTHDPAKTRGAYIYYAHTHWEDTWGGELLIENTSTSQDGIYIMPKPNRLVFLAPGPKHCIKRVEPSAGDNARLSVQGFFHATPDGTSPHKKPA